MNDIPETGDVFHYPYLWAWQYARGETEGRKERPCCTALVIPLKNGQHRIYYLPITTKPPTNVQIAIEVPRTEVQRAGLSSDVSQWVILNEWNREIFETSYYIADVDGRGSFSRKFTNQILERLKSSLAAGAIQTVGRE